jgi:hypothetical protein
MAVQVLCSGCHSQGSGEYGPNAEQPAEARRTPAALKMATAAGILLPDAWLGSPSDGDVETRLMDAVPVLTHIR